MTAQWQPGKLYAPGDIVQPRITDPITQDTLNNPDFNSGDTGWGTGGNWSITTGNTFEGTHKAEYKNPLLMSIMNADDNDNFATSRGGITWATDDIDLGVYFMGSEPQIEHSSALNRFLICHLVGGTFGHYSDDDGVTWNAITPLGDVPATSCRALAYIPELDLFFHHSSGAKVHRSVDGITWTASTTTLTGAAHDIIYSPTLGMLVAIMSTGNQVYTSTDGGDTWTARAITGFSGLCGVWSPEDAQFVLLENSGRDVATSSNGTSWSVTTNALPAGIVGQNHGIAYDPNAQRYVAIGVASPHAAYSDNGTTWSSATTVPALNWSAVIWDRANLQFVAAEDGGANSSFMTSPDGDVWTERTTSGTGTGGWVDLVLASRAVSGIDYMENTARLTVGPGQQITAGVKARINGGFSATVGIAWHGTADALLSIDWSDAPLAGNAETTYRGVSVTATAPEGALTCSVAIRVFGGSAATAAGDSVYFDYVTVSQTDPVNISQFLFKAVQANPGYSDSDEPVWPTVLSATVVDNEVTWQAINANRVVWRAFPILVSGSAEPTWPTASDGEVADNTISWQAQTRRVADKNCPNSKQVVIAASKVFAADGDLIAFSATVNPLDWTSANDAGFIPFGMNPYGDVDVTALGLYRSNVVGFNEKGFQMWQVDADPSNFAILDAVPIGCPYHLSPRPVSNDLVFLTEVGIRSMGIAGASTNLQAGTFGKQIDPLVKAEIKALAADEDPIGIDYPGAGQYWLIFGSQAFVLTMNGGKQDMAWSRYTFPSDIEDWTIHNKDLYLRSGDEVWRVSEDATLDKQTAPGVGTDFTGDVRWQYLDFGGLGDQKMMHGFDLVGSGACTITFGYDQSDETKVTANWTVTDIDTLPGTMIPMPVSGPSFQMRLLFSADQAWEWQAAALYLDDQRTTS